LKKAQVWLGLGVSALFLYLAFRKSDWVQIWSLVRETDFIWILAALPLLLLAFWLRALRWRYLLLPAGRPSLHSLFGAMMIGYMSLNLLPFRLGEFIRAYVLGRREGLSKTSVFATVVIERVFDGFCVLALLLIPLFSRANSLGDEVMVWVRAFSYLAAAIFAAAILFMVLTKIKTGLIIRLVEIVLKPFPRMQKTAGRLVQSFAAGLDALSDFRLLLIILVLSVLVWLATAAFYWVAMFGFNQTSGINAGLVVGPFGSLFVLSAIALGIMLPSSPGFVGTFELACITAMTALGVEKPCAESYAVLIHAAQFIPITLAGIIYLYVQNFSFLEIRTGGEAAQAELERPD